MKGNNLSCDRKIYNIASRCTQYTSFNSNKQYIIEKANGAETEVIT